MKKQQITTEQLARLIKQGFDQVDHRLSKVEGRISAVEHDLTGFKSEILTSVDAVMRELQAHRQEDKSLFALYVELRARQDKRDKAFAKALGLKLVEIDGVA